MPLGKNISKNISELTKKNKQYAKPGGKSPRSRKQIIAIAMSAARRPMKRKK